MGSKHHPVRLPNRIFHQSTPGTYPKSNTGPKGPRPKLGSGVRDRNPLRKRGHQKDNRGGGTSHSVLLLSNPQKEWTVASNSQPEAPKQPLCKTQKIQNGDIISRSPGSVPGPMGLECRSKRCILTCPHPREGPAVPDIRVSKSIIQVRRTSLRSFHSPKGLHPGHQCSGSRTEKKRGNPLHISRRLAYHRKLSHYSFPQYRGSSQPLGPSRVVDKSRKVLTRPFTNNSVPGSNSRPQKRDGLSHPREDRLSSCISKKRNVAPSLPGFRLAKGIRHDGKYGRHSTLVQTTDAPHSVTPTQPLSPCNKEHCYPSSPIAFNCTPPPVVGQPQKLVQGEALPGPQSPDIHHNRCLSQGLGSVVAGQNDCGNLVQQGEHETHQRVRAPCSVTSSGKLSSTATGPHCHSVYRQFHCGRIHQPAGWHSLPLPLPTDLEPVALVHQAQNFPQSLTHRRQKQHSSGRPLSGQSGPQRVGTGSVLVQSSVRNVRPAHDRSVCLRTESQTSNLLLENLPPVSLGDRCPLNVMGHVGCLCLPSTQPHTPGPPEGPLLQDETVADSTPLAQETVVPNSASPTSRRADLPSTNPEPVISEQGPGPPPRTPAPTSNCMETIRDTFRAGGLSTDAASLASHSRRPSTLKTYDSRVSRFIKWSLDRETDPTTASLAEVSDFLTTLFQEGLQVSTVRNYRSAIAAVHKGFSDGSTIGSNSAILHLLRGMGNSRPPKKKLCPAWSINDILHSLTKPPYEPIHDSRLPDLTKKTLFLIAASSARRRSCLHALTTKPGHIRFEAHGVRLIPDIDFVPKNQTLDFIPGDLFLPEITTISSEREDRKWCPVRSLKWYLKRTKHLRHSERLFVLPRHPYSAASKDTISKWLVQMIMPCTHDQPVRAHDIRGQATSKALFAGVPLSDIMKAAAWKTPSTFVSCYLTDTLRAEAAFGRAVLTGSACRPPRM